MAHIKDIFDRNFLEYASYVIKDRAIPDIEDGLKPVQRRILYTLHKMDDGTFHKVAAVVGQTMFLHPHGDSSIYEALVNLANRELFISKQGNFGNIFTGDPPAAARYIECSLLPFAKEILFNDNLTDFTPSYDGKMKEPVVLPCKIPLILILGAEGIAVGMSTRILPHNTAEVLDAVRKCLAGEEFALYPDFPTAGFVDVSQYQDGLGRITTRAKLDLSDSKKILITELPFGATVESLIQSIEDAAKKGKLKIGSINDFTTEHVEIEIELPRGVYAKDVEDALYAFTSCESSITVNCLMIKDRKPKVLPITQVIQYHAQHLCDLLKRELTFEKNELLAKVRRRTLERIFIEERIYKMIEELKTSPAIVGAVKDGLTPFGGKEFELPIQDQDIEHLLTLPIRRISLFDIEKNRKELTEMQKRIKAINKALSDMVAYACDYLDETLTKYRDQFPRRTSLANFKRVDVREAALRNLKLRFDKATGYLGYEVSSGEIISEVSIYDRVLVLREDMTYQVYEVPTKMFVGKGAFYIALADKDELEKVIFNIVYLDPANNFGYIKRFKITQFLTNKMYSHILPEGTKLLAFCLGNEMAISPEFAQKSLIKEEVFRVDSYLIKGVQAQGVRIKPKEMISAKFVKVKK
ncbi:MAG: DNA topoisomerase IV subunit A [Spirochaetia bacterium]